MRVIDRVRVPTLIITAEDDPFVPAGRRFAIRRDRQSAHHAAPVHAWRSLRIRRTEVRPGRWLLGGGQIVDFVESAGDAERRIDASASCVGALSLDT